MGSFLNLVSIYYWIFFSLGKAAFSNDEPLLSLLFMFHRKKKQPLPNIPGIYFCCFKLTFFFFFFVNQCLFIIFMQLQVTVHLKVSLVKMKVPMYHLETLAWQM